MASSVGDTFLMPLGCLASRSIKTVSLLKDSKFTTTWMLSLHHNKTYSIRELKQDKGHDVKTFKTNLQSDVKEGLRSYQANRIRYEREFAVLHSSAKAWHHHICNLIKMMKATDILFYWLPCPESEETVHIHCRQQRYCLIWSCINPKINWHNH